MKKMLIILLAMAMVFAVNFSAMADDENPSVPVKKIIHGSEGMTVIRAFSNWHNVTPNPSLRLIKRFNSYDGSWELIPVEGQEKLEGVYKMEFVYTNSYEINGFIGANDGGTGFQTISLDSLLNNFTEDPIRLLQKIKKIASATRTRNPIIWMAYSSEGLSVADTDYHWEGTGYKVIAILPCDGNGFVDTDNISNGYRGISLSDEVPHFILLKKK